MISAVILVVSALACVPFVAAFAGAVGTQSAPRERASTAVDRAVTVVPWG